MSPYPPAMRDPSKNMAWKSQVLMLDGMGTNVLIVNRPFHWLLHSFSLRWEVPPLVQWITWAPIYKPSYLIEVNQPNLWWSAEWQLSTFNINIRWKETFVQWERIALPISDLLSRRAQAQHHCPGHHHHHHHHHHHDNHDEEDTYDDELMRLGPSIYCVITY